MVNEEQAPLKQLKSSIRKVAIVRALHIGDLLLAVPAWRALRAALPQAEITLIGLPWAKWFVQRFSRYLDRWVEFPGYPGMLEVEVDPARTAAFLSEARQYSYDLAIQMHGDGSVSNRFTAELGAKYTAGYRKEGTPGLVPSFSLPYPENTREVLKHLKLVEYLGAAPQGTQLEFPLCDADYAEIAQIPELKKLLEADREDVGDYVVIGIHPGARPPARRWKPDRFAAVANELARRYAAKIVIFGGPGEESLAGAVQQRITADCVNVAGKISLGGMAAILSRISLFIGNDSGPSHIAEAVGAKSITLFGPADPNRWAPLDQTMNRIVYKKVECSPCPHWECPIDHRCLERIRADDVLSVADDLLAAEANGRGGIIEHRRTYEQEEAEDSDLAHSRVIPELPGTGATRFLSADQARQAGGIRRTRTDLRMA